MRLILQFCLLLLFGLGTHAWGRVAACSQAPGRGFVADRAFERGGDAPPVLLASGKNMPGI